MKKYDSNLIFLYSENSKLKLKDISQVLKKSSQRLKYSLRQLDKEGIVYLPHCLFDYSYFGLLLFRVYFKGGYVGEKDKTKIIQTLAENDYIVSIYELSGEFDLAVEMMTPNPSRFGKEIKRIIFSIPTLSNYKVVLNQVTYFYPRLYLVNNEEIINLLPIEILIGGDRKIEVFDQKELLLLKNLWEKPNIRYTFLAKNSKINVKTAVKLLADLSRRKIIRGYKLIVDNSKLNIHRVRLFLKIYSTSQERGDQLMSYLQKTKEIVALNKTIGDWDMEIDMESPDRTAIRRIIVNLREEFKDLIYFFNSTDVYYFYKKSYLPKFLFVPQPEPVKK